ncbi:MAG: hypothetical protein PHW41_01170 [Eubacteriales bacterium]|nr:hypothetical protein [Eubacteriales bacterium]
MAQALAESIFDALYLTFAIIIGIYLIRKGGKGSLVRQFGMMAIVLGAGDSFHLVPRAVSLWTGGLEANAAALGIGKLITSITMTIFYLILYYIWRERYQISGRKPLSITMWTLTVLRIALCAMPQNQWLSYQQPLLWGILRNIPFAIMGVLLIVLFAQEAKRANDRVFRYMWLAITLSFAFYIPVVLFAEQIPMIGMLMIPKTLAYVWVVVMGLNLYRQTKKTESIA